MQRLHYTGETLLIADELCEAVMRYAAALAESQGSDVVLIPVRDAAGLLTEAVLLLGPASQLYATPAADVADIDVDPALINDIRQRTAQLKPGRVVPESHHPVDPDLDLDMA